MRPWIKAGLIGAVPMMALTALTHAYYFMPVTIGIMVLSTFGCVPYLLLYTATGAVASFWQTPLRTPKQGATVGALAGLVTTTTDSLFTFILTLAFVFAGVYERYLQVSPEALDMLGLSGTEVWWAGGGRLVTTLFKLSGDIVIGVVLAAVGGILLAAIKKN